MDPYIVAFYLGFGICVIGPATRRPVATTVFLIGTVVTLWLGIGATLPIDKSLTLCLF